MLSSRVAHPPLPQPRQVFHDVLSFAAGIKTSVHQNIHRSRASDMDNGPALMCGGTLRPSSLTLSSTSALTKLELLLRLPSALRTTAQSARRTRSQSAPSLVAKEGPRGSMGAFSNLHHTLRTQQRLRVVTAGRTWNSVRSATESAFPLYRGLSHARLGRTRSLLSASVTSNSGRISSPGRICATQRNSMANAGLPGAYLNSS